MSNASYTPPALCVAVEAVPWVDARRLAPGLVVDLARGTLKSSGAPDDGLMPKVGERDGSGELECDQDQVGDGDPTATGASIGSAKKSAGNPAEKAVETGRSDRVGEVLVLSCKMASLPSCRSGVP